MNPILYVEEGDQLFVFDVRELETLSNDDQGHVVLNFKSGKTICFTKWTSQRQGKQIKDLWIKYCEGQK